MVVLPDIDQSKHWFEKVVQVGMKKLNLPASSGGCPKIWDTWKEQKRLLIPCFGEDGRLTATMPLPKEDEWSLYEEVVNQELSSFGEKLLKKDRFVTLLGKLSSLTQWLFYFCKEFLPSEVAHNRATKNPELKGMAVSTAIQKVFEAAKSISKDYNGGNGGLCFSNVAPVCLHMIPVEKADLAQEFISILFSRIVEILRPAMEKEKFLNVVLSINPLDLLMASMHTTNWKTCHNFFGGQVAAGPIAYICDPVTSIAYAYQDIAPFTVVDGGFFFPVKTWRQMVYFDLPHQSAIHSRHFPSGQPDLSRTARTLTASVLAKYAGLDNPKWWVGRSTSYTLAPSPEREEVDDSRSVDKSVLKSASWAVYSDGPAETVRLKPNGAFPVVSIGATAVPCVACGANRAEGDRAEIHCPCKGYVKDTPCRECQGLFMKGDMVDVQGVHYCKSCYRKTFVRCSCCDTFVRREQTVVVGRLSSGTVVCQTCLVNHYRQCAVCKSWCESVTTVTLEDTGEVVCSMCTAKVHYCEDCEVFSRGECGCKKEAI